MNSRHVEIKVNQDSNLTILDIAINRKSKFFNQDFSLVLAKLGNLGYKIKGYHTSYDVTNKIINLTVEKSVSQIQRDMNLIFNK